MLPMTSVPSKASSTTPSTGRPRVLGQTDLCWLLVLWLPSLKRPAVLQCRPRRFPHPEVLSVCRLLLPSGLADHLESDIGDACAQAFPLESIQLTRARDPTISREIPGGWTGLFPETQYFQIDGYMFQSCILAQTEGSSEAHVVFAKLRRPRPLDSCVCCTFRL